MRLAVNEMAIRLSVVESACWVLLERARAAKDTRLEFRAFSAARLAWMVRLCIMT